MGAKEQMIFDCIGSVASTKDIEIVCVEIVGSKKSPVIRIYIDTDNGVGFSELTSAESWISEIIERIDPFPGAYTLEVSSPGIDRPLVKKEHFDRFVGETVKIKTTDPIEGSFNFKGCLKSTTDDNVVVVLEDRREIEIPYASMNRANLIGKIEF